MTLCVDLYRSVDIEQIKQLLLDRKQYLEEQSDLSANIEIWRLNMKLKILESPRPNSVITGIMSTAGDHLTLGHFLNYTYAKTDCLYDAKDFKHRPCVKTHFIINTDVCFRWIPSNIFKVSPETNLYGGNNIPLFVILVFPNYQLTKFSFLEHFLVSFLINLPN